MAVERFIHKCRVFARACTTAAVIDVLVDRPGLTSACRPRADLPPTAAAYHAPVVYETCLFSCFWGLGLYEQRPTQLWLRSCREMMRYGNIGMGYTLLLAMQAASLGYSLQRYGADTVEHVMGSVRAVVEAMGVQGAVDFYRCLQLLGPSHLARIGYGPLPEVDGGLSLAAIREKRITLETLLAEAALYDPVSRDIANMMMYSLGYALSILRSHEPLEEAVARATYALAAWTGDLLLRRKHGSIPVELLEEAARGSREAVEKLYEELGGAGPGSAADLVVNALARLLYEHSL